MPQKRKTWERGPGQEGSEGGEEDVTEAAYGVLEIDGKVVYTKKRGGEGEDPEALDDGYESSGSESEALTVRSFRRRRRRLEKNELSSVRLTRDMIRSVYLVVDCSNSMSKGSLDSHLTPSKSVCVLDVLLQVGFGGFSLFLFCLKT